MRKVSLMFLTVGLVLFLLAGCDKAEIETSYVDKNTETTNIEPITAAAMEVEEQINANDQINADEQINVINLKNDDMIILNLDTIYQIDIDNDGNADKIDIRTSGTNGDSDFVCIVTINGEINKAYENFYYFDQPVLLRTADDKYLVALCYDGFNDYTKTDIYLVDDNHMKLTDSADAGIVSYADQVLVVGTFTELFTFAHYKERYILSNDGKLTQQGYTTFNHVYTAEFEFNFYQYDSETNQYQQKMINEGTDITLTYADGDTIWIELEDGVQGYFLMDDYFAGEDIFLYGEEPENSDEHQLFEAYRNVVLNESKFYSEGLSEQIYFNDLIDPIRNFSVVDMDGDGLSEVLLELMSSEILVLHFFDGDIYGYSFPYRGMLNVKTDGSHVSSGSAADNVIRKLRFLSNTYEEVILGYSETSLENDINAISYYIDDKTVTDEEFYTFCDVQNEKENVVWYEFSQQNITEVLSLNKIENTSSN